MKRLSLLLLVASTLSMVGCGGGKVPAAPPPLRPKVVDNGLKPPPVDNNQPADCEPTKDTIGALTFGQRSISESEDLVKQSATEMTQASTPGISEYDKDTLFEQAVKDLIDALQADPYNVGATYGLAAAYAQIDRPQCSINMLQRLIQMRSHASKKAQVEAKLDLLLGRKKQTIDPSFKDMRSDQRFRDLVTSICGTSDDCNLGH